MRPCREHNFLCQKSLRHARFGAFTTKEKQARQGRNPRTGESVVVAEKRTVQFRPGKEIRQRLMNTDRPDTLPELRRIG